MKGFHVSASEAIQGHHGPLVMDVSISGSDGLRVWGMYFCMIVAPVLYGLVGKAGVLVISATDKVVWWIEEVSVLSLF